MTETLTQKQQAVYEFIKKEVKRKGFSPSVREICDGLGLSSTSTVHSHLEKLQQMGYIRRVPSKNRTIEVLEEGFYAAQREHVTVPIVKDILWKGELLEKENTEGYLVVPASCVEGSACFAYRTLLPNNDEKIEAGDMVLLKQQSSAKASGELALVTDGNEVFVERHEGVPDEPKKIVGIVLALYRRY